MSTTSTKLEESPSKKKLVTSVFAALLVVLILALTCTVIQVRRTVELMKAHNDLKWVIMTLHAYHDKHEHFPLAVEIDEQGQPMHSWRTIIEPFLDSSNSRSMLNSYDFKQRWDSESNNASIQQHPLGHIPFQFLAVVGPHAAWNRDGPRKIADFKDGTANTIMLIGIRDSGIAWNEPYDAVFDGKDILVNGRPLELNQKIFAAFADGSVRYGVYRHDMAALFTIDAGDTVPEW